ncbi:MAG: hypothetical protein HYW45_03415 [Candidatus Daviesbacteria bacterium]|nr:MAG: hypothetical protein HYW45_03415 [Candidatus Daviesbacteria bacterium]
MEQDQIVKGITSLPEIPPYKIPEDHEIFEGVENGATFMLTKASLDTDKGRIVFWSLSVSGDQKGREGLIRDFSQVLGEPSTNNPHPINPHIQMLSWLIEPKI